MYVKFLAFIFVYLLTYFLTRQKSFCLSDACRMIDKITPPGMDLEMEEQT